MRIHLITGASGFVGRYLVRRLLESGAAVWVIVRPLEGFSAKERSEKLFSEYFLKHPNNFKAIEGDILEEDLGIAPAYLKELAGENVFLWHLAANLSFSAKDKDAVLRTNYIGTRNVVNLSNKIAERYIHVSTAYVCGDTKSVFRESDLAVGQKFRNHYEWSKFMAEKYVREYCKKPYLVFRPSIIMGDAYEGKAEGCTFGYYRFAYMFFVFKNWLTKKITKGAFLIKKILFLLGSRSNKDGTLSVPWLIIPCPNGGAVDIVPIDYVVKSMVNSVNNQSFCDQTVHLTNPTPPAFKFALVALIDDLGYRNVKYIEIPSFIFSGVWKISYYVLLLLRVNIGSVKWYLPYITRRYYFSHQNNQSLEPSGSASITRDFLRKINTYAKEEIFNKISSGKKL